jgi:hypothetical protein
MLDTPYARELARADINGCRIERLHVKAREQDEIRFSWWKDGKMATRPLDLAENELLPLLEQAINNGVFTDGFLDALSRLLAQRIGHSAPPTWQRRVTLTHPHLSNLMPLY